MKNIYLINRTDSGRNKFCNGQLETAVVVVSDHEELEAIIGGLFLSKSCDYTFKELSGEIINFENLDKCNTQIGMTLTRINVFAKLIGIADSNLHSGVINRSYIR